MGNPLLLFWARPIRRPLLPARQPRPDLVPGEAPSTEAIFLVLRRMRAPLIVLIAIFSVSILGLSLIPAQDAEGNPTRMTFFDAFYFMSYTATTIGYGELPTTFTYGQRLWVTMCIYLTVIGWAYAIGAILALGQDRAFRAALAVQGFRRRVRHLHEPFLIVVGYGRAGRSLGGSLDSLGRRFVVLDTDETRITMLEVEPYNAPVPGLAADARHTANLGLAGLGSPRCAGVLALTGSDETNLQVVIATKLLRPDLPVIARAGSRAIAQRMADFEPEAVIEPDGRFGEYLALSLLQPASYQLMTWFMAPPGTPLPPRPPARGAGRWVIYAQGQFADEMSADLSAVGLDVVVIEPEVGLTAHAIRSGVREDDPEVRALTDVRDSVGLIAGADNDTTNLSLIAAARAINPSLFIAARQNVHSTAPLLEAVGVDSKLVPTRIVADEVLARLVSPLLWQFLSGIPQQDNAWAAALVDVVTARCGERVTEIWRLGIDSQDSPAVTARLAAGNPVTIGDLLRGIPNRAEPVAAVALMWVGTEIDESGNHRYELAPAEGKPLVPGDALLLAGRDPGRRSIEQLVADPGLVTFACTGTQVPDTWVGRKFLAPRQPDPAKQ